MSVGIVKGDFFENHSGSWTGEWLKACDTQDIEHELIDWRDHDAYDRALTHECLLWHFSHYSSGEMQFARSILYALREAGVRTFPDFSDAWHFDDKVAQAYLLKSLGAPTPKNLVFYSPEDFSSWCNGAASKFPMVAKLRTGSGSHNVQLLQSIGDALRYSAKMFGIGFPTSPSLTFKLASNLKSSRSISDIVRRARRIPEFLFSRSQSKLLPRERGYVYLQDFIANAEYDLKVAVIRDKLSFIGRRTRKDDFRASGGGDLFFDKALMSREIIDMGFKTADAMKSQCVGMDVVVDPKTGHPTIVEISYGFSHTALLAAGGYYDRNGQWHDTPMNAPREILLNLLSPQVIAR